MVDFGLEKPTSVSLNDPGSQSGDLDRIFPPTPKGLNLNSPGCNPGYVTDDFHNPGRVECWCKCYY